MGLHLARAHSRLGTLELERDQRPQAREHFDAALAIRRRLIPASLDASSTLQQVFECAGPAPLLTWTNQG